MIDLDAIKKRKEEGVRAIDYGHAGKILASLEDIPALIAEVERLRAEINNPR